MDSMFFIVDNALVIYAAVLMLRFWMRFCAADIRHPLSQFIVHITNPPLRVCRLVVPDTGKWDVAMLALILLAEFARLFLVILLRDVNVTSYIALLIIAVSTVLKSFAMLLIILVIVRALLSWVMSPYEPFHKLLIDLTEPLMAPVRRILPSLGGVDLSPMVVVIILYLIREYILVYG